MTARPIAYQIHGHGCMDYLTTERSLYSQVMWVIDAIALSFYMLHMRVQYRHSIPAPVDRTFVIVWLYRLMDSMS